MIGHLLELLGEEDSELRDPRTLPDILPTWHLEAGTDIEAPQSDFLKNDGKSPLDFMRQEVVSNLYDMILARDFPLSYISISSTFDFLLSLRIFQQANIEYYFNQQSKFVPACKIKRESIVLTMVLQGFLNIPTMPPKQNMAHVQSLSLNTNMRRKLSHKL